MNYTSLEMTSHQLVDFKTLNISSPAFEDGGHIPDNYTCNGKNVSPPLDIEGIPEDAKCLAIIVKDSDAPAGAWIHWLVWNIPVTHHLKENNMQGEKGINSFYRKAYVGPCPPAGKLHRYFFKLYALDELLHIPAGSRCLEVERAMSDHIIAYGEILGVYK